MENCKDHVVLVNSNTRNSIDEIQLLIDKVINAGGIRIAIKKLSRSNSQAIGDNNKAVGLSSSVRDGRNTNNWSDYDDVVVRSAIEEVFPRNY